MLGVHTTPEEGIRSGISDIAVEIANRGKKHVLIGLERGARYAGEQRRAILNNQNASGQPITDLFKEYEGAMQCFENKQPKE